MGEGTNKRRENAMGCALYALRPALEIDPAGAQVGPQAERRQAPKGAARNPNCLDFFFTLAGLALVASRASAGVNTWTTNGPTAGPIQALAIDPSNPGTLFAGGGGGLVFPEGVFKTTNGGESWTPPSAQLFNTDILAMAIDPSTPSTLYAATVSLSDFPDSLFKSTDGGASWTESLHGHDVYSLAIDPSAPATIYAGTGDEGVLKSTDGGASWNPVGTVDQPGTYIAALAIDPTAPATIYASTGAAVIKSTNGGATWTKSVHGNDVSCFAINPSAPATIYAGTGGNGVLMSTDSGVNWSPVSPWELDGSVVDALAIDPSTPATIYAGTLDAGVFRSTDAGASWTPINVGLGNLAVSALALDPSMPSRLYAGTGGGVYEVDDYDFLDIGPCTPGPTALCLSGSRFKVTAQWTVDGDSGAGQAVALAGGDTGYFTFFDPGNVEVAVKILNGCDSNGSFWTFAGGLTNLGVVMTVTDSLTGTVKTYTNSERTPFRPILDTGAFENCTAEATGGLRPHDASGARLRTPSIVESSTEQTPGPCVPGATTLCLNGSRYQVSAQWVASNGASGVGQVINLTADTGAFWFFSPNNIEAVVKVLNGCASNSRYWTFAAGLTDVNVILTVTDTQTGTVQTYTNPQGIPFEPIQDTNAFATCP
jgi:hypothetical protein